MEIGGCDVTDVLLSHKAWVLYVVDMGLRTDRQAYLWKGVHFT